MGDYSGHIPKEQAKKLVVNQNDSAFNIAGNNFWLAYGDPDFLHFGRGHLEGELKLNRRGKLYYEREFEELEFERVNEKKTKMPKGLTAWQKEIWKETH